MPYRYDWQRAPGATPETAVDFRPFESIGVRFEWHARDGRFSMRAEGNGEWQGFTREELPTDSLPIGDRNREAHAYIVWKYNVSPPLTPSKDLVRWWKASCAELKRATKEDTKRNRTRNDPSYADRARGKENGAKASPGRL